MCDGEDEVGATKIGGAVEGRRGEGHTVMQREGRQTTGMRGAEGKRLMRRTVQVLRIGRKAAQTTHAPP
jgi:hypothetical protein